MVGRTAYGAGGASAEGGEGGAASEAAEAQAVGSVAHHGGVRTDPPFFVSARFPLAFPRGAELFRFLLTGQPRR